MDLCAFKRNNFIFNKLFPCLFFMLFFIMCFYGSKVFATSYTFDNGDVLDIDESNIDVQSGVTILLYNYNNTYGYFYFTYNAETTNLGLNRPNNYTFNFVGLNSDGSSSSPLNFSYKNFSGFAASPSAFTINSLDDTSSTTCQYNSSYNYTIYACYTNSDVYNFTSAGSSNNRTYQLNELVFQAPPQGQAPIIAGQVEEVEMDRILSEIMGILPIVLVVIVGLIALRKGIQFLMALMKRQ